MKTLKERFADAADKRLKLRKEIMADIRALVRAKDYKYIEECLGDVLAEPLWRKVRNGWMTDYSDRQLLEIFIKLFKTLP